MDLPDLIDSTFARVISDLLSCIPSDAWLYICSFISLLATTCFLLFIMERN